MNFDEDGIISEIRLTLGKFIEKEMPRNLASKWDKENTFPRDVLGKLAQLGMLGLSIPEEYGGHGRNILATMIVVEELSRRSLAVSVPFLMAACYAGMNLLECGTDEQKKAMLPKVASGELLFSYGWSEPDVGADLASVKTTAQRVGDFVRINGAKRFCSGSAISDYIYTLVRSGPEEDRYRNLTLIMVPPTSKGVIIEPIEAMGMKGAATTDVTFSDVEVPFCNVMGGENGWNNGWSMLVGSGLDVEKLEVAAISLGIARAALDDAWSYANERRQFGKPIAEFQSVQHKLAQMKTQIQAAKLMVYNAAWLADQNRPCGIESSMAKLFATETCKYAALECQTILGAYGYVKDFDSERYVRDALLMPIIGGSSAIQLNNIFKASNKTG